jgi:hypothetical protein
VTARSCRAPCADAAPPPHWAPASRSRHRGIFAPVLTSP